MVDGSIWHELKAHELKAVEQVLPRPEIRFLFWQMLGRQHEIIKKCLAALLEMDWEIKGFDFTPTGSMTLAREAAPVKPEADESYELSSDRQRPDLAVEVIILKNNDCEAIAPADLLPELDIELFEGCLNYSDRGAALREFRRGLKQ